jgi:NAD(P)-dependent dehydrogenase (short-subunit alcohol dehydrogenase family)
MGMRRSLPLDDLAGQPTWYARAVPGVAVVTGAGRGFGRAIAQRLAGRGYTVVATDLDSDSAAATAAELGGISMGLDVRDPDAHRAAARTAAEHGPLEVWVNNAGVMQTGPAWEQSDDEVRLACEVNVLGVIWGSRAAVEAMRAGAGENLHIVNIASMSSFGPVPGLAVYAATKHAVLGFTGSLQGDLLEAGIPIAVHALCPDGADTPLLREHDDKPAAAINWSGPRLLTADEVAGHAVALLDSKRLVRTIPAWRGLGARALALAGRPGLRAAPLLRRLGARNRVAFRDP